MSYNKNNEVELAVIAKPEKGKTYYISRDQGGKYVLREGSFDGKELFSPIGDDRKKQKKKERVFDATLLLKVIEE